MCAHVVLVCIHSLIQMRTVLHKHMMILRCAICSVLYFTALCFLLITMWCCRLLAKMCLCDQYPHNIEKFPRVCITTTPPSFWYIILCVSHCQGLALINTVYDHCLLARADPSYPLMLSLLRHCCKPYIMLVVNGLWECVHHDVCHSHIQQWIYEGVCTDQEEEFGIIVHDDYLLQRGWYICEKGKSNSHASFSADESYWTRGHVLSEQLGCCPVFFPKELSPTVFTAGKSLCLLKLCNPKVSVTGCMC